MIKKVIHQENDFMAALFLDLLNILAQWFKKSRCVFYLCAAASDFQSTGKIKQISSSLSEDSLGTHRVSDEDGTIKSSILFEAMR